LQPEYTPYARKHLRHMVEWKALVRASGGDTRVRVLEISGGGLAIETNATLIIGDRLTVVFDALPGQPAVTVTVARRIAKGFAMEGEIPAEVISSASSGESPGNRLAG
jgi:hypothetical protein